MTIFPLQTRKHEVHPTSLFISPYHDLQLLFALDLSLISNSSICHMMENTPQGTNSFTQERVWPMQLAQHVIASSTCAPMPGSEDLLQRCCPPECPLAPLGCIFYFCFTFVTDNLPDNHTTPHWLSCFLLLAATVPSSDGQLQDGVLLVISAPYPISTHFLHC